MGLSGVASFSGFQSHTGEALIGSVLAAHQYGSRQFCVRLCATRLGNHHEWRNRHHLDERYRNTWYDSVCLICTVDQKSWQWRWQAYTLARVKKLNPLRALLEEGFFRPCWAQYWSKLYDYVRFDIKLIVRLKAILLPHTLPMRWPWYCFVCALRRWWTAFTLMVNKQKRRSAGAMFLPQMFTISQIEVHF